MTHSPRKGKANFLEDNTQALTLENRLALRLIKLPQETLELRLTRQIQRGTPRLSWMLSTRSKSLGRKWVEQPLVPSPQFNSHPRGLRQL